VGQAPVVAAHDTRLMYGMAQPLSVVLADVERLRTAIWQIVLAVGVACLLVAVVVARTLARPINDIGNAARQFAQGEGIGALPTHRPDEIGDLARSFQLMHDALEQQMGALQKSQQELSDLARLDGLTGLANRRMFHERLQSALAQRRRSGQVVALLCLDLDSFKQINDTHGHDAGDCVLKTVAQRLRANTREVDTPVRLGGDEFAVVVAPAPEVHQLATLAEKLVQAVSAPIPWQNQVFHVGCSMGIACTPVDGECEASLMSAADAAMYAVKQTRQGGFKFRSDTDAMGHGT
jgi:diguanylate cyclase (GGDEF)-like protein